MLPHLQRVANDLNFSFVASRNCIIPGQALRPWEENKLPLISETGNKISLRICSAGIAGENVNKHSLRQRKETSNVTLSRANSSLVSASPSYFVNVF